MRWSADTDLDLDHVSSHGPNFGTEIISVGEAKATVDRPAGTGAATETLSLGFVFRGDGALEQIERSASSAARVLEQRIQFMLNRGDDFAVQLTRDVNDVVSRRTRPGCNGTITAVSNTAVTTGR